jgi:hypothetical protein
MNTTFALTTNTIHPDDDRDIACITIDPEFKNLIPAISDDERKQLEQNIIAAGGVRDPLTLWLRADEDWVILDGHNRFEICQRLKLPFSFHQVEFNTRDEAADWIDKNQLGRRNLSQRNFKLLIGRIYNRATRQGERTDITSGKSCPKSGERTSERVAKEHGVSEKTVRNAGKFQKAVEKLGITGDLIRGTVHASEAEIVAAADSLPEIASDVQREAARQLVKRPAKKATKKAKPKGKQEKPAAAPSSTTNDVANEIRTAVVKLWQRLKDKFPPDEHGELRNVMAAIIRDERKQAGK